MGEAALSVLAAAMGSAVPEGLAWGSTLIQGVVQQAQDVIGSSIWKQSQLC